MPITLLHVEDDEQLGASMALLLRAQGYQVLTATEGPGALARLAQTRADPDVLIMDFRLPGEMDGADVAQEICRRLARMVPTIFLTGYLSSMTLPWAAGSAAAVCGEAGRSADPPGGRRVLRAPRAVHALARAELPP